MKKKSLILLTQKGGLLTNMGKNNIVYHDFYCIGCGNKVTLPRKRGHLHKDKHLKKYFCIVCHGTINHIECKNENDVIEFKRTFAAGEYIEEAKESMAMAEPMTGFMKER